jgi:hypothetical protein
MPANNQELLIDHLDKTLHGESIPEAEALLQNDASAREDWQYLQAAVDAVHHLALHAKVTAIRAELQAAGVVTAVRGELQSAGAVPGRAETPARKLFANPIVRNLFRIAAAIVSLLASYIIYKFATVNNDDFYKKYYSSYELPTSRGNAAIATLELAYRNADFNSVNTTYNAITTKTNKDHFLAGMASLELKQYPQAIDRFTQVLNNNTARGEKYFQDETEYYLALAFIANDQADKALPLIKRIKTDINHPYRSQVNNMSGTDLKILELK